MKAKLAMRAGDFVAADLHLARAEQHIENLPRTQLALERTILAMKRDDFDGALRFAYASCSWVDVAWVAERVSELDALKRFVDALPEGTACPAHLPFVLDDDPDLQDWHRSLRWLLARRLLRAGRWHEALAYFPDTRVADARLYVSLLDAVGKAGTPLERARQLYNASIIIRRRGFDLMATETAPDFRWTGGWYDPTRAFETAIQPWLLGIDAGPSAKELARVTASAPAVNKRYHHRFVASQLAEAAANVVSPRSQAFTALLCTAARYISTVDAAKAQELYFRANREGPLLLEPMQFGVQCPEPRFVEPPPRAEKPIRKRWKALIGVSVVASVVAIVVRRRRVIAIVVRRRRAIATG